MEGGNTCLLVGYLISIVHFQIEALSSSLAFFDYCIKKTTEANERSLSEMVFKWDERFCPFFFTSSSKKRPMIAHTKLMSVNNG